MLELQHIHKMYNPGTINEICLFEDFNLKIERSASLFPLSEAMVPEDIHAEHHLRQHTGGCRKDPGQWSGYFPSERLYPSPQNRSCISAPSKGTCPSTAILENLAIADNKGKAYGLGRGTNHARMDAYRELLASVGFGLEDKMHTKVGALSGGQRQTLALLMATMKPIEFLILDEHTAALDPKTAEIVMQAYSKNHKKRRRLPRLWLLTTSATLWNTVIVFS